MIQIQSLYKTYRTGFLMRPKQALQGVDLQVNAGEIFGFIGPNGAGKSTTIKILTGLLRPSQGTVSLLKGSPQNPRSRARMGYLPEHPYFYDYLTGRELLRFYGSLSGLQGRLLDQRIEWALELVHANQDWTDRRLRTYSKGMLQRMGLAQAILAKPELLILDEPMSGLDPMGRRDLREAILALNREGATVFYSSHVLADVEQISHKVAMIVDGRIVHSGSIAEMTASESTEFRILLSAELPLLAPGIKSTQHPHEYICPDGNTRDQVIAQCLAQGIDIIQLTSTRPSLEDILTREVTRAER